MEICGLLILGVIIGGVGRLVVPGYQPIGFLITMFVGVLGIVGGNFLAEQADIGSGVLRWILIIGITAVLVLVVAAATRKSRELDYGCTVNVSRKGDTVARIGSAVWRGSIKDGGGSVSVGSGALEAAYSFSSRFEDGTGTNPEELMGAAHAGCFSMALSKILTDEGHPPTSINTQAEVSLALGDSGPSIDAITLRTTGDVPGIDETAFQKAAEAAKANCPVSKALAGVKTVNLEASLA